MCVPIRAICICTLLLVFNLNFCVLLLPKVVDSITDTVSYDFMWASGYQ